MIENHVITSAQVKVKSFQPDTSGLLQEVVLAQNLYMKSVLKEHHFHLKDVVSGDRFDCIEKQAVVPEN